MTPDTKDGFGFDAVWADDLHHVVRVSTNHQNEGYRMFFPKGDQARREFAKLLLPVGMIPVEP